MPHRIADNTLVALTLMIAESRTEEKDIMVKVVVNLINKNNYYTSDAQHRFRPVTIIFHES